MPRSLRPWLTLLIVFLWIPATPARAQRGQLIEDLFRTIADAQLEREQRKRLEAEQAASRPPEPTREPLPIPRVDPPGRRDDGRTPQGAINVRSREAAEFAQHLVRFNAAIEPMVGDLQRASASNVAVRPMLPDAYRVAADSRALIQACDGLASVRTIVEPYCDLDRRWRQLSFQLRSLDGLSNRFVTGIRTADDLVGKMSRQLQVQPQFDRRALHDLMMVAATYMQALMDDLQVVNMPRSEMESLTHDCRLLRQRLLAEADRVEETSYEDVVTRFTDFASRWSQFSERVYSRRDPHLQLRLDRIGECGDQTYALLWMPPPYNASTLAASARRLQTSCGAVLDQLTIRSMVSLRPQEQTRVLETSHRMYRASEDLARVTTRGVPRSELQQHFSQVDKDWRYLRPIFYRIPSLSNATLSSIDHECDLLRSALGVTGGPDPPLVRQDLIQVAAALEGSAEYFDADVRRYQRYLTPASYRKSIGDASQAFLHHARQLHEKLSRRSDLQSLQQETEHMLRGWTQLTKDLGHIESHGLSELRASNLHRAHQELVPLVAKIAAALSDR